MDWPINKYKTIYADPPWHENGGGKIVRGANRHYALMRTSDIEALPVSSLAENNAHLYLWTTNNFLPDALRVMAQWGFEYKTMITWAKERFGIGQYFRGQTEHCLFGVRGCLPYRVKPDGKRGQGRTLIIPTEGWSRNRQHSEKPPEMRSMIEVVSHAPYIELFARQKYPNWDAWGDQLQANCVESLRVEEPSVVGGSIHMRTTPSQLNILGD